MFKTRFSIFETEKLDRFYDTEIVAMMSIMGVVVTHDTTVVASMDAVIDVGEVVPGNFTLLVIWAVSLRNESQVRRYKSTGHLRCRKSIN